MQSIRLLRTRCQGCASRSRVLIVEASTAAPPVLSPRQRKLAAKKKQRKEQQQQQQQAEVVRRPAQPQQQPVPRDRQQQQQQPLRRQPLSAVDPVSELAARLLDLQQQQQQQEEDVLALAQVSRELESLSPPQLAQLVLLHATCARRMASQQQLAAATPGLRCLAAAALALLAAGQLDRQQLADVAFGLAHWDSLAWRVAQQQDDDDGGATAAAAAAPVLAGSSQEHSSMQQDDPAQQQQPLQPGQPPLQPGQPALQLPWSGPFQEALAVPFLVLPNLLPHLKLDRLMPELTLNRDVILLRDKDGAERLVPESRLTGWQSDVGATFCYSGKEMQPSGERLTPTVAQVRDTLRVAAGQHYDSVLINYYADGKAGMRYHSDPTYGCWSPAAAVVSVGDGRRFIFRDAADHGVRWGYLVSSGDVVFMWGDCQERLQHAVRVEPAAGAVGPRISLVYKQRLPGC